MTAAGAHGTLTRMLRERWVGGAVVVAVACTPFGVADRGDASSRADAAADQGPASCSALSFDATDDWVEVPDADDLDLVGSSTIEAWIYLEHVRRSEYQIVSHHDHGARTGWVLMVFGYGLDTMTPFQLGASGRYYDGTVMHQTGFGAASPVGEKLWTHVALTNDGGRRMRVFVDGSEEASSMSSRPPAPHAGPLHIGKTSAAQSFHFGGRIDEVRISNVERYTGTFTPQARFDPDPATVALYHFDEGTGTSAADATGRHPGVVNGAKWVPTGCSAR
jgi:hypothetical protein